MQKNLSHPLSAYTALSLLIACLFIVMTIGCSPNDKKIDRQPENQTTQTSPKNQQSNAPANASALTKTNISPTKESFQLVMLGDSITAGFGLNASEALPVKLEQLLNKNGNDITVINAGVSGDTTKDALNRFDWSVGPQANGILIALGGNDLLQGISPDLTKANLEKIIQNAKARNLTILLTGMKAPGNYGLDYQREFDGLYPELAKQYSIPLYPFLLNGVATNSDLNQNDGIHPNIKGVKIISNNLADFIADTVNSEQGQ